MNIWDFWAKRYSKLWVQRYSLRPTREYITNDIGVNNSCKVLDIGCGPGELIHQLKSSNPNMEITGLDFSKAMIQISEEENPHAKHIQMDVENLNELNDSYDIIISTHSLPYWKNLNKIFKEMHKLLNGEGIMYIGFASGNSWYDRLSLFFVKFTTGSANYLSHDEFTGLTDNLFNIIERRTIKERWFMPSISIYKLKKATI